MTFLLAVSTAQKFGSVLAVGLALAALTYTIFHLSMSDEKVGSEREIAPNRRPPEDDETLEGPRLTLALGSALMLLLFIALATSLYWLREPSRQAGAIQGFDKRSVNRGKALFATTDAGGFGCAGCHGPEGVGGSTNYSLPDPLQPDAPPKVVTWKAPALNVAALLYSDPEGTDKSREKLRQVIIYGRPNTPMPPWGVEGGGPMNAQQIDDLVNYIRSIALKPADAQKQAVDDVGLNGAKLFDAYCARCHTRGWSYNETLDDDDNPLFDPIKPSDEGNGAFGPTLRDGATVRQFPTKADHVEFIRIGTIYGKAYGTRGVGGIESGGMPGFGKRLTDAQIQAIVDYERSL